MIIIETCPDCGHDLRVSTLLSAPPKQRWVCDHCGWSYEEKREEVIRVPFQPGNSPDSIWRNPLITPSGTTWAPPACRSFPNHPSNGGSGNCNCTLGGIQFTC